MEPQHKPPSQTFLADVSRDIRSGIDVATRRAQDEQRRHVKASIERNTENTLKAAFLRACEVFEDNPIRVVEALVEACESMDMVHRGRMLRSLLEEWDGSGVGDG